MIERRQPPSAPTRRATARASCCTAQRLFAERGANCVSMDEIAEAAGVGKGTLFRRFGSRAALARPCSASASARLQEGVHPRRAAARPGRPAARASDRLRRGPSGHARRQAELLAAAEVGAARFVSAPYGVHRLHVTLLLSELDPRLRRRDTSPRRCWPRWRPTSSCTCARCGSSRWRGSRPAGASWCDRLVVGRAGERELGDDLDADQVRGRQLARGLALEHRLAARRSRPRAGRRSGSRVVSSCSFSPGHITARTQRRLRLRPANLISSKEMPAISGTPRMRVATSQYQAGSPIGANTKIATIITTSRKLVPQRGCSREKRWALAGVSGRPASKQEIVLCSAPWYSNTRRRSRTRESSEHVAEEQARAHHAPRSARTGTRSCSWCLIRLVRPTGIRKNSTIASASATHDGARPHAARGSPVPRLLALLGRAAARWRRSRARGSRSPSTRRARRRRARSAAAAARWRRIAESSGKVLTSISPSAASSGERSPSAQLLGGRLAHGHRPVGDAAHHHALEHRLTADRRVARRVSSRSGSSSSLAVGTSRSPVAAAVARSLSSPRPTRWANPRPDARPSGYWADRACAECRRPLATRRWKRSTRPPVSISFCRPV